MDLKLFEIMKKNSEKVKAILNILLESPYFYVEDSEEYFRFLNRYKNEFGEFFKLFYDWELIMDSRCARLYKSKWYNEKIKIPARQQFSFRKRDESIAFMCLLKFYEEQLVENNMTAEDKENLKFEFGDLLQYCYKKFNELFPDNDEFYTEEYIRGKILRPIIPELIKYRFIELCKPDSGVSSLKYDQYIYEALPALNHYNASRLGNSVYTDLSNDVEIEDEDFASELDTEGEEAR